MPNGSAGKILALMSGGIDSPVASYLMAKRGAENIWLHFHSYPLVSNASIQKVKELAERLLVFQPKLTLFSVPFQNIQIMVKTNVPAKYRILVYRRFMLRIAEKIAQKTGCKALVTGESLGQVSSQTLENIVLIQEAVRIPIFRPLIALDKEEIIKIAKDISTYEISIRPQEDCCTLFTPAHSTALGNLETIYNLEKTLEIEELVSSAVKEAKILKY